MHVRKRKHTHFLNLVEDRNFARAYFQGKDLSEYNNDRLNELKDNLRKSEEKYNQMLSLLSLARTFNLDKILDISSKLEEKSKRYGKDSRALDKFESELACLIFLDFMSIESAKELGFNSDYIKELLLCFKKQIINPYDEYYYDEKTERTYELVNGKYLGLSYTPEPVRKALADKASKSKEKFTSTFLL